MKFVILKFNPSEFCLAELHDTEIRAVHTTVTDQFDSSPEPLRILRFGPDTEMTVNLYSDRPYEIVETIYSDDN